MRIAVVGAYGNGKTTLTTKLAETLNIPRVHGTAMKDPWGTAPKSLDDCSDMEVLQLTFRRFAERIAAEEQCGGSFVSDGSTLHEWVYLTVRLAAGRHPEIGHLPHLQPSTLSKVVEQLGAVIRQRTAYAYDLFVHLPADVPLHEEETSINEQFRRLSDRLMLEILDEMCCPVHIVAGDVEERALQVAHLVRVATPHPLPDNSQAVATTRNTGAAQH